MEHPILFLDLILEKFGVHHFPPQVTYAVVVALILVGLGWLAGRQISLVPKGAQNVFELIVGGLEEFMVDVTGEEGRAFFPFIATFFLFIMTCNLVGCCRGSTPPRRISIPPWPWPYAPSSIPTISGSSTRGQIYQALLGAIPAWRRCSSSSRSSAISPGALPDFASFRQYHG